MILSPLILRSKIIANNTARKFGYQISRYVAKTRAGEIHSDMYYDLDEVDKENWSAVVAYTLVTPAVISSLRSSVEYIIRGDIQGDLVECGVWKGGCSLTMVRTLKRLGISDRHLYCYDTFDEGWPEAGENDVTFDGRTGSDMWEQSISEGCSPEDLWANYDKVKEILYQTGYPQALIHLVKGKVEDTIPENAPDTIALLRLDTDWYSSTKHNLEHLFPRLVHKGVLIVDDYGVWQGARKAVDEYFKEHGISMFLHRVDALGCYVGIKC